MTSSSDSGKSPFFVRKATGLVRDFSARDMLFLNIVSFGGAWSIIYALEYVPLYGGNPLVALLLTAPGILALLGVYYIFQVSMPRSGGDYIFMGRVLHPAIALAANFAGYAFFLWFWIGDAATVFTTQGLAQTLSVYGSLTGASWATNMSTAFTPITTFIVGSIVIALFTAIVLTSSRWYFRIQNVAMVIAVVGLVVIVGLLASTNVSAFTGVLNNYVAKSGTTIAGGAYQNATAAGGTVNTDYFGGPTFLLIPLFFTVLFWVYVSNYTAGETKEVRRSARTALFGSFAIIFLATIAVLGFAYNNLGSSFLAGAGGYALGTNPFPVTPNLTLFAALLANNSLLVWFIGIGVIAGFVLVAPQCMILMSRILFGYSFDRVIPTRVADVNERFHTPVKGILVAAIGGEVFLAFLSGIFGGSFSAGSSANLAFSLYSYAGLAAVGVTFTVVSISAILFPYRRKSLYETSCPVKRRILRVPVISWLGIVALAYTLGTFLYYSSQYQFYFGAGSTLANDYYPFLGVVAAMFIGAIVWFYVARWYRNKSGIPFDKAFQEIPPE